MLSQEEMKFLFRDMMTALDVGKKAEMGYYDVEFDTFGCATYDGKERHYHVGANAARLFDFCEHAALENIYPTIILEDVFKKPIPRGLKEILAMDLKKDLAKKLQSDCSLDFLQTLTALAKEITQSNACTMLNLYMDQLEYTFDRDKLDLYESTLIWAVNHKKLSKKDYLLLLDRVTEEKKNIVNELQPHDIFNKVFHSFAYEDHGYKNYVFDARKDYVYKKKVEKELSGTVVSPILSKTCFYNYDYRLTDARRDYLEKLDDIFDPPYFSLLQQIKALAPKITKEDLCRQFENMEKKLSAIEYETMVFYGHRWDIL